MKTRIVYLIEPIALQGPMIRLPVALTDTPIRQDATLIRGCVTYMYKYAASIIQR